ncbi:MAG: rRNA maturation RNase YbeY [Candidatus Omnitrophica bacterium]|nr:rRNA maturation RNase YbeY [Candidatus Omnitrophota bacterium]
MLKIVTPGVLEVTFLSPQRMRAVNRKALHHDCVTDVISFRYQDEPVAGEIFVAPSEAHRYAKEHGIPYEQELARYVLHGLLHWLGHDDRTPAQQRTMRMMEDRLLTRCDGNSHG